MFVARSALVAGALLWMAPAWSQELTPPFDQPEHRAFDFWAGDWRAVWQSRDPETLDAYQPITELHHRVAPILDGKALLELAWPYGAADQPGLRGMSIRYLDEVTGEWVMAQHWPSPANGGIAFTDQLRGGGEHGRFNVYSYAASASTPEAPAVQRYTFSDIAPDRFRWDRARTTDGGTSWTTDLVMHFNRIETEDGAREAGQDWANYGSGAACTEAPYRAFDAMVGQWSGTVTPAGGEPLPVSFEAGRMLDGCAVAGFLTTPTSQEFVAWSYWAARETWVEFSLSSTPGEGFEYKLTGHPGEGAVFELHPELVIASQTEPYAEVSGPVLNRSVWTRFAPETVTVEMQVRDSEADDWRTTAVLELEKEA